MLDTIVLTIQRDKFSLLDPIQDLVAPWDLQSKTSSYEKYVKNPSARDKNAGIYQPRLTGVKRWTYGQSFQSVLKVEFSVPKLLYGSNLEEVDDADFPQVIELLRSRLFRMYRIPRPPIHFAKLNSDTFSSSHVVCPMPSKMIPWRGAVSAGSSTTNRSPRKWPPLVDTSASHDKLSTSGITDTCLSELRDCVPSPAGPTRFIVGFQRSSR
jgi:hypothetical protein